MPEENVEMIRETYAAWQRSDEVSDTQTVSVSGGYLKAG